MDIIIIGAGASGIVTAINAKNKNNRVRLLEKNDRIGKKLCLLYTSDAADDAPRV